MPHGIHDHITPASQQDRAALMLPELPKRNFPLRLASITLPESDNGGQSLEDAHEYLRKLILDTFGGFTSYKAHGVWRDETTGVVWYDANVVYQIAMEDHGTNMQWLEDTARLIGATARQIAVAITYPNGVFKIIPTCEPA